MRLPRFCIRTLMIAVSVVGLLLVGVLESGRRRTRFRQLEYQYMWDEVNAGFGALVPEAFERDPSVRATKIAAARRLEVHYGRLRDKYERAARYPWLPVPADPPLPN